MFLRELYQSLKTPGALGGVKRFYKAAKAVNPEITIQEVKEFLATQRVYTLHKPIRKPKTYRRVLVKGIGDLFQADLVHLQMYSRANNSYKYACHIIDVFTKRLWVFKLKTRSGLAMKKALASFFILNRANALQCDQGTEFFNHDFKTMMDAFGIRLYHTHTDKKASIVERVQRTIREKLERYFTLTGRNRWIDIIDEIVENYNNTIHGTIKMKPAEVRAKHTPQILKLLYPKRADKSIKFSVGDEVRAVKARKNFQKRSRSMWQPETFTVLEVKDTNPKTYKLGYNNVVKAKSYYSAELQKVG